MHFFVSEYVEPPSVLRHHRHTDLWPQVFFEVKKWNLYFCHNSNRGTSDTTSALLMTSFIGYVCILYKLRGWGAVRIETSWVWYWTDGLDGSIHFALEVMLPAMNQLQLQLLLYKLQWECIIGLSWQLMGHSVAFIRPLVFGCKDMQRMVYCFKGQKCLRT